VLFGEKVFIVAFFHGPAGLDSIVDKRHFLQFDKPDREIGRVHRDI
jgi:hypothetical protein